MVCNIINLILIIFSNFFCIPNSALFTKAEQNISIDSVKQYHCLVNQAELSICRNDYSKSIENYKQAFLLIDSPFPIDIYNYILVNIYEEKYDEALKYSENLVKLGAELKFWDQIPLNRLKENETEWSEFKEKYVFLHNQYIFSINHQLKLELLQLEAADQSNYCGQTIRPFNPTSEDSICTRITQIITEYGYPNHDIIGLNIKKDTVVQSPPQDVILTHLFQTKNKSSIYLNDLLIKDIYKGRLKPERAIQWIDYMFQGSNYGLSCFQEIDGVIYFEKFNFEFRNYELFERNRDKIFAPPFKDALIKSIYLKNNPTTKFRFFYLPVKIINTETKIITDKNKTVFDNTMTKLNTDFNNFLPSTSYLDSLYTIHHNYRNDTLQGYHKLVNEAELEICNLNFGKASAFYESAFKNYKYPFIKDIYNAILCNIYIDDYNKAFKYSKLLVESGVVQKFFTQTPFNKMMHQKNLWSKFVKSIPAIDLEFTKSDKNTYRKEIIYIQDKFYSGQVDFYNSPVYEEMISFIKKHGYPNQKNFGIRMSKDSLRIINPEFLLENYFKSHSNLNDLSNFLLSEIFKGNISPSQFINIDRNREKVDYTYGTPVVLKYRDSEYYVLNDTINKTELKRYNLNRTCTLNCSVQEEIKKQIFIGKHKELKFDFELYGVQDINNIIPFKETDTYKKIDLDDY